MRTLAIDLGARRVGLALSDEGGRIATPFDVLEVSSSDQTTTKVLDIIPREGVQRLLVGVPLNMDESLGPAAKAAIDWGRELAKTAGLPVIFVDERLSSFAAEQGLIARKQAGEKITRKQKKSRLDALAAAGFLQAFLDGKLAPLQI